MKYILCPEWVIIENHVHLNIFADKEKINTVSIIVLKIPHG
jgi:hypothetical protein